MKNIISFKVYNCGSEKFNLSELYKECDIKSCEMPVNVFLMEHKRFGNIIFNSGYSEVINKNPIIFAKYKSKHRIKISDKQNIVSALSSDGLDPLCIKKVILTHADPECSGALPLLPKYELLSSAQVLCTLDSGFLSDGVIKSTIPNRNIPRRAIVPFNGTIFLKDYFKWVYDVLGDGSVFGVDLSGHSKAMMGYFIPEKSIFIGGSAALTEQAITNNYTPTQKLLDLQYYPEDYLQIFNTLKKIHLEHSEIKFLFIHSIIKNQDF